MHQLTKQTKPCFWYAFYNLRPGNRAGHIFTTLKPTWRLLQLKYSNKHIYNTRPTSNVTSVTAVRSASAHLFADTLCPLVSVITRLYYVAISFHH